MATKREELGDAVVASVSQRQSLGILPVVMAYVVGKQREMNTDSHLVS